MVRGTSRARTTSETVEESSIDTIDIADFDFRIKRPPLLTSVYRTMPVVAMPMIEEERVPCPKNMR